MKRLAIAVFALIVLGWGVPTASADTIYLNYWELSLNNVGPVNPSGFPNPSTLPAPVGLPAMVEQIWDPGQGSHSTLGFFDLDVIGPNNVFNNEIGTMVGTAAPGQSWQIGDPYALFGDYLTGTLTNAVSPFGEDDVGMAMGWTFDLAGLEKARVRYYFATALPEVPPAFYLQQHDPGVSAPGVPSTPATDMYLWSTLEIAENFDEPVIPEPGTMLLVGTGLIACARRLKRR